MSDLTSSAPSIAAAGISTAIATTIGIAPHTLMFCMCAATFAALASPQASRTRTAFLFVAVVMLSALFGTYLAHEFKGGSLAAANTYGAIIAMFFYPFFNAISAAIPQILATAINVVAAIFKPNGGK